MPTSKHDFETPVKLDSLFGNMAISTFLTMWTLGVPTAFDGDPS